MKRLVTLAALLLLSSGAFASTLKSLSQSEVNAQLKGKTITTIPLVTMSGSMVNNTFTGYFDNNGKIEGRMASQPENGPTTDSGTWTVKPNGTLCATWQHWNDSKAICVSIYKVNNGLLFVNDTSHKLETAVLNDNIKDGNQLG